MFLVLEFFPLLNQQILLLSQRGEGLNKVKCPEDEAPEFEVQGVIYQPLLDVLMESFQGPAFEKYHLTPFEYCHDPALHPTITPSSTPGHEPFGELPPKHQHVYGEIYTSPAMMKAHLMLPPDPTLETVVAAYMFWSDSTHLANFGNESKYTRAQPTSNACQHQAYIPSLPDDLADQYCKQFRVPLSSLILTHLKHELMHAVWVILLSAEFIEAYIYSIVLECYDGVKRRIFPHIFTYSADYPEKVLLATIKYLGGCPCPRCLDMKTHSKSAQEDTPWLQHKISMVRQWIFASGQLMAGSAVDKALKAKSLVPTRNAFSKLREYGFNFYSIFVLDFLHEFELGVWKAVFTHCIQILHVIGVGAVSSMNERYRKVPTFGWSTI
ncbi:hypothetical protein BDN71DRAFT_1483520 [Pleurotus eryngii]|uniref:Uncharacterized protein n=1 Tax=Pleurotus eryngii TaxID=5323 RepID=A0A9P5ZW48_PLEER|nr:hypothetical protein BDN71DRAFT_1483520 [Pleurotus eryngii]